jgi:aminomethyltransferase
MVGKKLPLNDWHVANGARMIDEGGWQIPESYGKVELEYAALRNGCGFADLTHEARYRVEGQDSAAFLQKVSTTNIERLSVRHGVLAYLCNDKGTALDLLMIYRDENYFLLIGSGQSRLAVIDWLQAQRAEFEGQVTVDDISSAQGHIGLRGPGAATMLERVAFGQRLVLDPGTAMVLTIGSARTLVIRRPQGMAEGYDIVTGAIYLQPLWDKFAEAARATGARPIGLAAREIYRVESGIPRNGLEMGTSTTPIELNQPTGVDFAKGYFVGRRAMLHASASETTKLLVGLRLDMNAAIEPGAELLYDTLPIGVVTSTVVSPALRCRLALGFVNSVKSAPGTTIKVRSRGDNVIPCEVVKPADLMKR